MGPSSPSSSVNYRLCPLYFFNYDGGQIDLPGGLQIIKIPRKFVEYLDRNYPDTLPTILSEATWAIAIKNEQIDTTNMSVIESMSIGLRQWDDARNQLFDLITALRLYKKGRIVAGLQTLAKFHNSKWSIGGSTQWTSVSNILFFKEEPTYNLKQSELQKLITLFQQIRQYRASNILLNIKIALERFHSSYHNIIEDRIIDQMIAFESLFISADENKIKKKLSFRTAFLIRNRTDHRNIVVSNMKNSYKYRSNIVHDNNPPNRDTLREVVDYTGYYLRQSILKFLSLLDKGYSIQQIRNKLKEDIHLNDQNITY
ncbi:hypothetical protein ACFLTP_01855 [Chloroflexota bacterium]